MQIHYALEPNLPAEEMIDVLVRSTLADRRLDALVVTSLANLLYLTNFNGSSAIVIVTADRLLFITDFRYVAAIDARRGSAEECPGLELVRVETTYDETVAAALAAMNGARVGFEAAHLAFGRHAWIAKRTGAELNVAEPEETSRGLRLIPTEGIVERARVRKDEYELALRKLVKRKAAGKTIEAPKETDDRSNVIDLMEALRQNMKSKGRRAAALSVSAGSRVTSKPRSKQRKRKAA